MNKRSRHLSFGSLAWGLALLVATLSAAPATASVDNASIRQSFCSKAGANGLDWRGRGDGMYPDKNSRSMGHTGWCATTYKIKSSKGGSFDYYAVEMTVRFINKGIDYPGGPATVTVRSNKNTQDNYYTLSSGKTSTSCNEAAVGVNYGVLTASIPFKICDSAKVSRSSAGPQGATYKANDVSKVKKMSFVYMQKVRAGVKPTFSGTIRFPFYIAHAPDAQHPTYWYTYSYGQTTWSMRTVKE
jgi:hypothetical protein